MGKATAKLTPKRRERAIGWAIGSRGAESEDLKALNEAIATAQSVIIDILSKIDTDAVKVENVNDFYKLANALSGLSRARTESEKCLMEASGLVSLAGMKIIEEIKIGLSAYPDLYEQLLPIMDRAVLNSDMRTLAASTVDAEEHKPNDDDLN